MRRPLASALLLAALAPLAALAAPAARYDGLVLPFREVVVAAPAQARIESIAVKEGDTVAAGATLAQLYARIEELDLARTQAALEKKEFDYKGAQNLADEKIVSADEALKAKIELDLARLQHDQAAEIVAQRTIRAPIAGIVVEQKQQAGETVNATQPLFRLVDIAQVYVQFHAPVESVAQLRVGDAVTVRCTVAETPETFTGAVDFIDPRVDAASGLLRVKVLVPNADARLKPGLRAEVLPGRGA